MPPIKMEMCGEGWGFAKTKQTYLVLYVNVDLEADWEIAQALQLVGAKRISNSNIATSRHSNTGSVPFGNSVTPNM